MRALRMLPLFLALLTISCLSTLAHAERRTALVIGNSAYKTAPLKNPTNDAQDMASALREMGFDVTLKVNVNHRDMEEAVRAFGTKLKQGGLGLFYYAGHGVQVAGENYLIPLDTKVDAEADVKFGALNAGMVLARMEDAGNGLNIVILDACRTNPFARSFRTAEQGLARMDAPKGSLIAYATAPGRVAADSGGSGRNGVYTGFLLQHMRTPGLKVEEALKRVRADVVRTTADKQVPWESSSLIGDFMFLPTQSESQRPLAVPSRPENLLNKSVGLQTNKAVSSDSPNQAKKWFEAGLNASQQGDQASALTLYKQAAESGLVDAQTMLCAIFTRGIGEKKKFGAGINWCEKAVAQEHAPAQYILGGLYDIGHGVGENPEKAFSLYSKAAEQGHTQAQFALASMYLEGKGTRPDIDKAVKWFQKAALSGDAHAQDMLGRIALGAGDSIEAVKWFDMAARQDLDSSKLALGLLYFQGKGVPRNYAEALRLFKSAAKNNNDTAAYYAGLLHAVGAGTNQNFAEAAKWYNISASMNNPDAQFELGVMYEHGKGVIKNQTTAISMYKKSAEQNNPKSQYNLGAMYARGDGALRNNQLAYFWLTLAASQGLADAAKARSEVASMMSPAQIAEAEKTAAAWKPKAIRQQ